MNRPRFDTYSKAVLTVIAVCLVWLSAGCTQIAPHDVVRARRLVLVDEEGRDRVVLQAGKDGPNLKFLDGKGQVHSTLEVIEAADQTGQVRTGLLRSKKASAYGLSLVLLDKNGEVAWRAPPR